MRRMLVPPPPNSFLQRGQLEVSGARSSCRPGATLCGMVAFERRHCVIHSMCTTLWQQLMWPAQRGNGGDGGHEGAARADARAAAVHGGAAVGRPDQRRAVFERALRSTPIALVSSSAKSIRQMGHGSAKRALVREVAAESGASGSGVETSCQSTIPFPSRYSYHSPPSADSRRCRWPTLSRRLTVTTVPRTAPWSRRIRAPTAMGWARRRCRCPAEAVRGGASDGEAASLSPTAEGEAVLTARAGASISRLFAMHRRGDSDLKYFAYFIGEAAARDSR
jgi:hypothetical protein